MKTADTEFGSAESKREEAKNELDKYMFYFERFQNHEKSERQAREMKPKLSKMIDRLHDIKQYPLQELEFIIEACEEVIRCRQVLKYTYAYGYYLSPGQEKQLFEFL